MSTPKSRSRSGHYCAVRCCKNNSSNCNVSFFRFPKDLDRAKIWVLQCGREELLEKLRLLYNGYRVCGVHFETRMFLNDLKNRLQSHAVPLLLLKQESPPLNCVLSECKTSCDETQVVDLPFKFEPHEHLYNCAECSYQAGFSFQLDHHVQKLHNISYVAQVFHAIVEPEKFSCCSYKSQFMCELYEHYKHAHDLKNGRHEIASFYGNFQKYSCNYCKFESNSSLLFVKHQDLCKSTGTIKYSINKYCSKCAYKTKHKGHWKRHKQVHNHNRNSCKHCSYRAKHQSDLQEHNMLKHALDEEISWFQCDHCSYRGKLKEYLKKHMLQHAPDEECDWFTCQSCSYRTKKRSNLKIHMVRHAPKEEINWFQCNQCSYQAKHKANLKRHMLQHASDDEVDWFQCDICSYRTKRKGDLKLHRWKHTTKKASFEESLPFA